MKNLFFVLLFLLTLFGYSQVKFEEGYFIDNLGRKTECLIKNLDWLNNPVAFTYKLSENEKEEIKTLDNVTEFSIIGESKFISREVNIDRSSANIKNLTNQKEPIFTKEKLFLNVLVQGNASLFSYRDGELIKYFYKLENSEIIQLISKKYINEDSAAIYNNDQYLVQLWTTLKCPTTTTKEVEQISYEKNDLVKFFNKYNACHNSESIVITKKASYDWFNFSLKGGLNFSSFSATYEVFGDLAAPITYEFDKKVSFRYGVEAEFVLPFNKNRWAIVLEPSIQTYNSETNDGGKSTIDYKSIEFTFGVRHYMFLTKSSKLFLNLFIINDSSIGTEINLRNFNDLLYSSGVNGGIGIGFKFKNKMSLEYRYLTKRNLLFDYQVFDSQFNSQSIILGYTVF